MASDMDRLRPMSETTPRVTQPAGKVTARHPMAWIGMAIALVFSIIPVFGLFADDREFLDLRFGTHGEPEKTRIVVEVSNHVPYRVFTLTDPDRIVIDLRLTNLSLTNLPGGHKQSGIGKGLVDHYRFGRFRPGLSRIVLDTPQSVVIGKLFTLAETGDKPWRLVLDLHRDEDQKAGDGRRSSNPVVWQSTDFTPPARDPRSPKMKAEMKAEKSKGEKSPIKKSTVKKNRGEKITPPPYSAANTRPFDRNKGRKPRIVIDAGHGGIDPGALAGKIKEKSITLRMSRMLRDMLVKTGRYDVRMTRDHDTFLSLRARRDKARKDQADIFISIHADSNPIKSVRGFSVYTLSEQASDREAAALAARENTSDIIAGVDLSRESKEVRDILIDLTQRETMNLSVQLATSILQRVGKKHRLLKRSRRFAGFAVLKAPETPSILIELGYLSNMNDRKNLQSRAYLRAMARAITDGIADYIRNRDRDPFSNSGQNRR